jgi:hypothetical protein
MTYFFLTRTAAVADARGGEQFPLERPDADVELARFTIRESKLASHDAFSHLLPLDPNEVFRVHSLLIILSVGPVATFPSPLSRGTSDVGPCQLRYEVALGSQRLFIADDLHTRSLRVSSVLSTNVQHARGHARSQRS